MRKTYQIDRLVTANLGIHDFADLAAVAVWWAQNGAAAGTTIHRRMTVVASLEAVYPAQPPPAVPSAPAKGALPPLASTPVSIKQHPWAGTTFPSP